MEVKHVSDVVDYEKDIQPYYLTLLLAGVGAGKTSWLGKLADKGIRILEVTSRRSTANAQIHDVGAGDKIDLSILSTESRKIDVITNAQLANYCKTQYKKAVKTTWLWEYYDLICLDECHSIVADASFADSCFYVENFFRFMVNFQCAKTRFFIEECKHAGAPATEKEIEEFKRKHTCKTVFMTGTPDPIEYLFNGSEALFSECNRLDVRDICNHVEPEEVCIASKGNALGKLYSVLQAGEKAIYYVSAIKNVAAIMQDLKRRGLEAITVGIDFSNDEVAEKFDEKLLSTRKRIRESLLVNQKIPEDIQLFITTTRNKEGINIYNEDIHFMFCETVIKSELIQMAGRVRPKGGIKLQVGIYDAYRRDIANAQFELIKDKYCQDKIPQILNSYRGYCIGVSDYEESKGYGTYKEPILNHGDRLSIIEKDFPMIRYNRFSGKLEWFTAREKSIRTQIEETDFVHRCVANWLLKEIKYDRINTDGITDRITTTGKEAIQDWFKYSKVSMNLAKLEKYDPVEPARTMMYGIMLANGISFGEEFNREQRDILVQKFSEWLKIVDSKSMGFETDLNLKNLGPIIKKLDWTYETIGHKGNKFVINPFSPNKVDLAEYCVVPEEPEGPDEEDETIPDVFDLIEEMQPSMEKVIFDTYYSGKLSEINIADGI